MPPFVDKMHIPAQASAELASLLDPKKRYSTLSRPFEMPVKWKSAMRIPQYQANKPFGLWYAMGGQWLDWCSREQPDWACPYVYEVEIVKKHILILDTVESISAFIDQNEVARDFGNTKISMGVNWEQVARSYGGIEISTHHKRDFWLDHGLRTGEHLKGVWLYGWDVDSGCVWDAIAVHNVVLRYQFDPVLNRYIETANETKP